MTQLMISTDLALKAYDLYVSDAGRRNKPMTNSWMAIHRHFNNGVLEIEVDRVYKSFGYEIAIHALHMNGNLSFFRSFVELTTSMLLHVNDETFERIDSLRLRTIRALEFNAFAKSEGFRMNKDQIAILVKKFFVAAQPASHDVFTYLCFKE